MDRNKRYRNHGRANISMCCRKETEPVVREGLAYSPAQMAKLNERGMPVTGLNASDVFIDGEENPSFHVGAERERFVDVADLWEKHVTLRDKARRANKAMKLNKKTANNG